jgi:hypothetical protein
MTAQPNTIADPFAGADSKPSISFKDKPIGTSYTGTVTKAPELVQARDYESGQPAFWPDGNPKQTVVTSLLVNGEELNLWAAKPSALFRAIADAQKAAGAQITVGGTLTVTFAGEKPNEKNPRLNPQKLYTVTYQAPNAFGDAADQGVAPQAAPPASSVPSYTPEQIAAAKAAGIPLPGVS